MESVVTSSQKQKHFNIHRAVSSGALLVYPEERVRIGPQMLTLALTAYVNVNMHMVLGFHLSVTPPPPHGGKIKAPASETVVEVSP